MDNEAWVLVAAVGIGGLGLGTGLVVGAFVARALRRYMRDEDLRPYGKDERRAREGGDP